MMNVYLDSAATTKLSEGNIDYVSSIIRDYYGNANSHHSVGDKARILLEETRMKVAEFIGSDDSEIIFTPSGSASNTLGIKGYYDGNNIGNMYILHSPIAHKSIINYVKDNKYSCALKVSGLDGFIDIDHLDEKLSLCNKYMLCPLVVVDYANSEIGTIQDVEKIISITHTHGGVVYLDCTASIPYIKTDVKKLDVDMIGFSGHKLNALKGVGVLYKKNEIKLSPIIYGSQENGLVGGTYNIPAIASLGYSLSNYDYGVHSDCNKRDYLLNRILNEINDCYLVGSKNNRIPNNINICFKDVDTSRLIVMLDSNGIQVSSGSACNSGTPLPSYVLKEIGMSDEDAYSCIRITLNGEETYEELDYVAYMMKRCILIIRSGIF